MVSFLIDGLGRLIDHNPAINTQVAMKNTVYTYLIGRDNLVWDHEIFIIVASIF
jgi:hypothetical protein